MTGFSLKIIAIYSPIFVSFIWGITLFAKNYKSKNPGFYMAFVQISALFIFAGIAPFYHDKVLLSVRLEPIFFAGLLSIFPFVYFYVRFITTKQKIKPTLIYLHLLPAAIISIHSLFIQFSLTQEEQTYYALRQEFIIEEHNLLYFFTQAEWLIRFILVAQSIFYLYKCSKLINSYKSNVRAYFSNIKGRYVNWTHFFHVIFGISLLASIPPLLAGNSYLIQSGNHLLTVCFFTLSLIFYLIAYVADNHSYIEDEEFYLENKPVQLIASNKTQNKLAKQVEHYFIESKPYLNKELKVTDIAVVLGTNRTYISNAIRLIFQSNFNKYVNHYRVEEAVMLFNNASYDQLSTVEISEQVGFHTYSSFAQAFKAEHKTTPAVYRKKLMSP